jgi:hypothetical protein
VERLFISKRGQTEGVPRSVARPRQHVRLRGGRRVRDTRRAEADLWAARGGPSVLTGGGSCNVGFAGKASGK